MEAIARIVPENIFLEDGDEYDRNISPGFHIALDDMRESRIGMIAKWYLLACHDDRLEPLLSEYFASRPNLLKGGYLRTSRDALLGVAYWNYMRTHGCPIL